MGQIQVYMPPYRQFLPSTGRLVTYRPPSTTEGVRVDTGVYEGGEIPMYYDSMIAKLITHGANREEAILKMQTALNQFVIKGIDSNIPFQATLMQHPDFQSSRAMLLKLLMPLKFCACSQLSALLLRERPGDRISQNQP